MLNRIAGALLAITIVPASFAQPLIVPFDVCVRSDDWTRPSADVQAQMWRDPRYRERGPAAYEWTHHFIWTEPDSASISYHSRNLSGLWTDDRMNQCPRRDEDRERWRELWALNHRVTGVVLADLVYTISVVPQERGYEIIQLREPDGMAAAKPTFRIVDAKQNVQAEWVEISPGMFEPSR